MKKVEGTGNDLRCPKCPGLLDTYTLHGSFSIAARVAAGFGWVVGILGGIFVGFGACLADG